MKGAQGVPVLAGHDLSRHDRDNLQKFDEKSCVVGEKCKRLANLNLAAYVTRANGLTIDH